MRNTHSEILTLYWHMKYLEIFTAFARREFELEPRAPILSSSRCTLSRLHPASLGSTLAASVRACQAVPPL